MSETAQPFECLGFDATGSHYFMRAGRRLRLRNLHPFNLLRIAPLAFWREHFRDRWQRVDWLAAADSVIRAGEKAGQVAPVRSAALDAMRDHWQDVAEERRGKSRLRLVG